MATPGVMDSVVDETDKYHYVGQVRTGTRFAHGRGTCTWKGQFSGHKYEGEWKDDKMSGQGVYTWPDGSRYEGEWKDGKASGQGVHIRRHRLRQSQRGRRDVAANDCR